MKNQTFISLGNRTGMRIPHFLLLLVFLSFWTSCNKKNEPFSILSFRNGGDVCNYSKSLLLSVSKQANDSLTTILGTRGDLFILDDFMYQFPDTASREQIVVEVTDSILFVNGKVSCINFSDMDSVIPWIKNLLQQNLSGLQMINIGSDTIGGGLRDLEELAGVRPDAGIVFSGDFSRMEGLLKLFHPALIVSPTLHESDYAGLAELTTLKTLFAEAGDSVMNNPLPALPSLKCLALTEINGRAVLTKDLLVHNKQIEKVVMETGGRLDISFLRPLENLKELVISGADSILNLQEISRHKNLEVLVLAGEGLEIDPSVILLPHLRWVAIPSGVTQNEFNALLKNHPNLEVVEIFSNEPISSLQALSGLSSLSGLTVVDTLTDLNTVKTLKNLKYLSLPQELLEDSLVKAGLHLALPNTKITANDGFCLGSGWLLLLLPIILTVALLRKSFGRKAVKS